MSWTRREASQLDDADDRTSFYELVLQEADSDDDLRRLLDAGLLKRVWRSIYLPRPVRAVWELLHLERGQLGRASLRVSSVSA